MIASVLGLPAEDWTAIAACCTALVAVVAGVIAFFQVREARRLRREQTQPYVVVYVDQSRVSSMVADLVVKNLGATAATNVRIQFEPFPQRAAGADGGADIVVPGVFPVLVPGQEWRTLWDTGIARGESDLPDAHRATVTFADSHGKETYQFVYDVDWGPLMSREFVTEYGIHEAADALREIKRTLGKWQESIHGGLAVFTRDGDARDADLRKRREERLAEAKRREAETTDG
jgi:hypothetical protein